MTPLGVTKFERLNFFITVFAGAAIGLENRTVPGVNIYGEIAVYIETAAAIMDNLVQI